MAALLDSFALAAQAAKIQKLERISTQIANEMYRRLATPAEAETAKDLLPVAKEVQNKRAEIIASLVPSMPLSSLQTLNLNKLSDSSSNSTFSSPSITAATTQQTPAKSDEGSHMKIRQRRSNVSSSSPRSSFTKALKQFVEEDDAIQFCGSGKISPKNFRKRPSKSNTIVKSTSTESQKDPLSSIRELLDDNDEDVDYQPESETRKVVDNDSSSDEDCLRRPPAFKRMRSEAASLTKPQPSTTSLAPSTTLSNRNGSRDISPPSSTSSSSSKQQSLASDPKTRSCTRRCNFDDAWEALIKETKRIRQKYDAKNKIIGPTSLMVLLNDTALVREANGGDDGDSEAESLIDEDTARRLYHTVWRAEKDAEVPNRRRRRKRRQWVNVEILSKEDGDSVKSLSIPERIKLMLEYKKADRARRQSLRVKNGNVNCKRSYRKGRPKLEKNPQFRMLLDLARRLVPNAGDGAGEAALLEVLQKEQTEIEVTPKIAKQLYLYLRREKMEAKKSMSETTAPPETGNTAEKTDELPTVKAVQPLTEEKASEPLTLQQTKSPENSFVFSASSFNDDELDFPWALQSRSTPAERTPPPTTIDSECVAILKQKLTSAPCAVPAAVVQPENATSVPHASSVTAPSEDQNKKKNATPSKGVKSVDDTTPVTATAADARVARNYDKLQQSVNDQQVATPKSATSLSVNVEPVASVSAVSKRTIVLNRPKVVNGNANVSIAAATAAAPVVAVQAAAEPKDVGNRKRPRLAETQISKATMPEPKNNIVGAEQVATAIVSTSTVSAKASPDTKNADDRENASESEVQVLNSAMPEVARDSNISTEDQASSATVTKSAVLAKTPATISKESTVQPPLAPLATVTEPLKQNVTSKACRAPAPPQPLRPQPTTSAIAAAVPSDVVIKKEEEEFDGIDLMLDEDMVISDGEDDDVLAKRLQKNLSY